MLWQQPLCFAQEQCRGCLINSSALQKPLFLCPSPSEPAPDVVPGHAALCRVPQPGCAGRLHRSSCLPYRLLQRGDGWGGTEETSICVLGQGQSRGTEAVLSSLGFSLPCSWNATGHLQQLLSLACPQEEEGWSRATDWMVFFLG